ncbi:MAG: peptidase M64 [Candidatus Aminicenantes bacterium]|nr:MAG: peptidase M64 [Candidatus Aminicenantes bacterium]
MSRVFVFIAEFLLILGTVFAQQPVKFDDYFVDKTMRIDYFHIGDAKEEEVTLDQIYQQGIWAGSKRNLVDKFDNGRYYVKIYDALSGKLLFSKGFDSYFAEYKTTAKAMKSIKRAYHESVLIPYPKKKIRFRLEARNRENILQPFFSHDIDPAAVGIIRERVEEGVEVFEIIKSGKPHKKVDVAFIAEGYTRREKKKFKGDLERLTGIFLRQEPYRTLRASFNIYGVFKPSGDSGCDEPRRGIFKNTALSATFNSLGSERYLLTEDNKSLRDIAAHVPYDTLVIMVNHKRYGGGGIYNLYCTFTVDNQWFEYLFLHEFGHSFAGLADEYYTSSVAYNEFYPRGIEPKEPNITALLDSKNLKWKDLLTPGVEIPTPWEKEGYEEMDYAYQKIRREINAKIATMKKEGAAQAEVNKIEQESDRLSREHAKKVNSYFQKSKFKEKVGAFEGAGYSAQGLYRPMLDCLMFTRGKKPFCKVCEKAVVRVIKHYSKVDS